MVRRQRPPPSRPVSPRRTGRRGMGDGQRFHHGGQTPWAVLGEWRARIGRGQIDELAEEPRDGRDCSGSECASKRCDVRCGRIRSGSNKGAGSRAARSPGATSRDAIAPHSITVPAGSWPSTMGIRGTECRRSRPRHTNGRRIRRCPRHPPGLSLLRERVWPGLAQPGGIHGVQPVQRLSFAVCSHCKITTDA